MLNQTRCSVLALRILTENLGVMVTMVMMMMMMMMMMVVVIVVILILLQNVW